MVKSALSLSDSIIMTVEKDKSDGVTVGQPHLAKQVLELEVFYP
jgi:hypothetical protein